MKAEMSYEEEKKAIACAIEHGSMVRLADVEPALFASLNGAVSCSASPINFKNFPTCC